MVTAGLLSIDGSLALIKIKREFKNDFGILSAVNTLFCTIGLNSKSFTTFA